MRMSMKFLIPTLAATALLAACGSSSSSSSSTAAPASQATTSQTTSGGSSAIVKTASNQKVGGTILVNASGMTLYHLSGEQGGKFICASAACTQTWPPLAASSGGSPSGTVGSLGTVKRPDGTEQVTYKGMPLYTFAHDSAPGDANGQGIKDVGTWTAVTTGSSSGGAAASPTTSTSSSSSSSGGGYAY
jgi:predicted lipoprotein with Yx(FWY)xxD motif